MIRGDLSVIPIEDSLLYVEPIYLRAEGEGQLPELKRTIVYYDDQVVMTESLDQSLAQIFGETQVADATDQAPDGNRAVSSDASPVAGSTPDKVASVKAALEAYESAQNAAKQGNWAEFGRHQDELGKLLEELNRGN